jgi:3-hydroxyisobutyrate dehydrogenase-like beta-hydroxyacid dehydrogenase
MSGASGGDAPRRSGEPRRSPRRTGQESPSESESIRYGFVGLGSMGAPMASHLVDWPGGLTVFDVREEAMVPLVVEGAVAAGSVREVGERSDIVSLVVLDDGQVTDVTHELFDVMASGSIIAVHSTIRPETAERLAAEGEPRGIAVADAPVSGSTVGATEGTLAVLFGGAEDAYRRCKEPFGRIGTLTTRFGEAGTATRAKIARNLINYVAFTAAGEAQRLADAAGIDLQRLGRVVRHSDAVIGGPGTVFIREHAVPFDEDDPLRPFMAHGAALGRKDLDLALELAAELGVDVPVTTLARDRLAYEMGVATEP